MDLFWIIYLIEMLSAINVLLVLSIFVIMVLVVMFAPGDQKELSDEDKKKETDEHDKYARSSIKAVIALAILLLIMPSKNTAYKMLAAHGVSEAYAAAKSSEKIKAIAGKSLKVLDKAMDEYLTKEGD